MQDYSANSLKTNSKAWDFYRLQKYDDCLNEIAAILGKDRLNPDANYLAALIFYSVYRFDEARMHLDVAKLSTPKKTEYLELEKEMKFYFPNLDDYIEKRLKKDQDCISFIQVHKLRQSFIPSLTIGDLIIEIDQLWSIENYFKEKSASTLFGDGPSDYRAFQEDIIENGFLRVVCPVCGSHCISQNSYPVFYHLHTNPTFYEFSCCVQYYAIVGFPTSRLMGLYVEGENQHLIIGYLPYNSESVLGEVFRQDYGQHHFRQLIAAFNLLRETFSREMEQYRERKDRKITLLYGFQRNMSHFIREEAFYVAQFLSNRTSVDILLSGGSDYFGMSDLIPIAPKIRFRGHDYHRMFNLFPQALKLGAFALRLSGEQYDSRIWRRKLLELAKKREFRQLEKFYKEIGSNNRIIWLTIRGGPRRWVNQVAGLTQLINNLAHEDDELLFALDGIPGDRGLVTEIINKVASPENCIDFTRLTLTQSLVMFDNSVTFVMPYSNANVFPYLSDKPGIFHGTRNMSDGNIKMSNADFRADSNYIGGDKVVGDHPQQFDYNLDVPKLVSMTLETYRNCLSQVEAS